MNASKFIFILIIGVLSIASCKKDDVAGNGLTGTWVGKWGFQGEALSYDETWKIKSNGKVEAYDGDGQLYAEGTCSVDGISFKMQYTPIGKTYSYQFSGLYHDQLHEIIGTWGESPSSADGGDFEMHKQ